jgi:ferredoxin--NADP+ reductase
MLKKVQSITMVEVLRNNLISKTSAVLQFNRFFSFRSGQVIGLTTHPQITPRLYSISSGEQSTSIEILYKVIPAGELTPLLNNLQPGQPLFISSAFGTFLAPTTPAYLIATGTGIAPFLSMIRSGLRSGITLLHGSRELMDFYYAEYLETVLNENYIQCYTGTEDTSAFRGRVTEYLSNIDNLPYHFKYYLCGSAEMVVDVRELLIHKGIAFQNIVSEIYF